MPRSRRVEAIVSRLPARIAAHVDRFRPHLAAGYGGPMNGQHRRVDLVRDLFRRGDFDLVVETGTHRGTTTAFLWTLSAVPIVTVETDARLAHYSRRRLRGDGATRVIQGDSPLALRRLATDPTTAAARPFFYLDAHHDDALPLRYELLELVAGWPAFCALIDDFRVPDDPGYGYGRCGPGLHITTDLFAGLDLQGVSAFWPTARAAEETGHGRGMILLARGDATVASVRATAGLREDPTLLAEGRLVSPPGGPATRG